MSPRRPSRAGSIPRLTFFHGQGCSLCERARAQLDRLGLEYDAVDITGDEALEARHREWLPVLEVDGERAFVYYIDDAALLRKLAEER